MTRQHWFWMTIIMVGAAVLLFWDITTIPPGITHDEADHSLSAWEVVEGMIDAIRHITRKHTPLLRPTVYQSHAYLYEDTAICYAFAPSTTM